MLIKIIMNKFFYTLIVLLSVNLCMSVVARAEEQPEYLEANYVEIGINDNWLSEGLDNWYGVALRGSWQQNANNIWEGEILHENEYNTWGTYFVAGVTHIFNEDWYGSMYIGAGDGAFFFPKFRIDAFINRKLLADKNLVATLGVGYEEAQQVNSDERIYLGASYYFEIPLEVEGGVWFNKSEPGPVRSNRYRVAATYGRPFERYLIAEFDWGREAYQFISEDVALVDFNSQMLTLTWREWMARNWGFALRGQLYWSDEYNRQGIEINVFKHY